MIRVKVDGKELQGYKAFKEIVLKLHESLENLTKIEIIEGVEIINTNQVETYRGGGQSLIDSGHYEIVKFGNVREEKLWTNSYPNGYYEEKILLKGQGVVVYYERHSRDFNSPLGFRVDTVQKVRIYILHE